MVSLDQTFYCIHNVINSLRIQPSLLTTRHNGHFDGRISLRETSLVACLVPWRLKCLENGKPDFCERSMSIAQWTMGTFSIDA